MTRKRYIKLLMAYGISRNSAVKIAKEANEKGISYDVAYSTMVRLVIENIPSIIEAFIVALPDIIQQIVAKVNEIASEIAEYVSTHFCAEEE